MHESPARWLDRGIRRLCAVFGPSRSDFFCRHPRLWRVYVVALAGAAFLWRLLLFRTTFIAITGSVGKTTAKDCLAAILSQRARTIGTGRTDNWIPGVPWTILRVRPWHRYAVVEVGAGQEGTMRPLARLVRPHIVLVLGVSTSHTKAFRSLEAIAAEKARLVEALGRRGHAVLNGEDELVRAMAARCRGTAHLFGSSPEQEVWYDQVSAAWPCRLKFTVHTQEGSRQIETNLVGAHWAPAVTAAIAAARLCGLDLETIAAGVLRLQPHPARMQPVELPCGATAIRDEYSAAPATFLAAAELLRQARAVRRIAVMTQFSDSGMSSRDCYRHMARQLAGAADLLIFMDRDSRPARKVASEHGMPPENVHSFDDIHEAAQYLRGELRSGDFVLLKGRSADHVSRVYWAQLGDIRCWVRSCRRTCLCDECEALGFTPFGAVSEPSRPAPM